MYSIEAEDKVALTEYLESSSCRRAVLARHLDGNIIEADCLTTNSILCDRCQESLEECSSHSVTGSGSGSGSGLHRESNAKAIYKAL